MQNALARCHAVLDARHTSCTAGRRAHAREHFMSASDPRSAPTQHRIPRTYSPVFGPSARITFLEQRAHVSQKSKSAMKLSGNLICLQQYADNSVHALIAPPDSFSVPNQSSTASAPNSPFRAAFQSPQAPKHLWPPRDFKVRRNARIVCWAS